LNRTSLEAQSQTRAGALLLLFGLASACAGTSEGPGPEPQVAQAQPLEAAHPSAVARESADLIVAAEPVGPAARPHPSAPHAGPTWLAMPSDSICGLRDARMLSNPARVDLAALLDSTPEMALLARQDVDPDSVIALHLRQQALDRCVKVCEALRVLGGYCSVWSSIHHRDGRLVPDLTEIARARVGIGEDLL
jgi:hypothetical protein